MITPETRSTSAAAAQARTRGEDEKKGLLAIQMNVSVLINQQKM
jgi:hypothetical protein